LKKLDIGVTEFERKIGVGPSAIAKAIIRNSRIKEETIVKVLETFPEVNENWLRNGIGEILLSNKPNSISTIKKGIIQDKSIYPVPLFDVDFTAGFIEMHPSNPNIIGYVDLPQFRGCDAIVTCRNNSMSDVINPNDWVGIRRIMDKNDIEFGGIYGIVTVNFRLFKYLKESEKTNYILVESENKQYKPRHIHIDDLIEIWVVQVTAPASMIKMYL